jgi:23S rRNA pseudouridine2605 synthase
MNNTAGTRIQKVLSDQGIFSRRKAEEAIRQGRVTVNGRPCQIGQKINIRKDLIAIDGAAVRLEKTKQNLYLMLNKPRGYVTTTSDEHGRKNVMDLVADAPLRVYPAGRLDMNSEGLLLLTNDGAFANTVMHPSNHISKTYRVTVHNGITEEQTIRLSTGVEIEGGLTKPATVLVLSQEPGRTVMQITITEGRNRQIRKMCEAVGLEVARLKRTGVGPLKLGMLQPGKWRELKPSELIAIRNASQKAGRTQETEPVRPAKKADKPAPRRDKPAPKGDKFTPRGEKPRNDRENRGKSYGGKPKNSWENHSGKPGQSGGKASGGKPNGGKPYSGKPNRGNKGGKPRASGG